MISEATRERAACVKRLAEISGAIVETSVPDKLGIESVGGTPDKVSNSMLGAMLKLGTRWNMLANVNVDVAPGPNVAVPLADTHNSPPVIMNCSELTESLIVPTGPAAKESWIVTRHGSEKILLVFAKYF